LWYAKLKSKCGTQFDKQDIVPVARYSGAAYPCVPMTLVET